MNRRTILRSMARSKMQGVKRLNRPYHTKADKDGYNASPFARHWREVLGLVPVKAAQKKPSKPTLFRRFKSLFAKKVLA